MGGAGGLLSGTRLAGWVWSAAFTPLLPLWWVVCALHPRLRRDLAARFGAAPAVPVGATWIHGSSLGEQQAAQALAASWPSPVLLTADTDTGAASARTFAAGDPVRRVGTVRPVDHPWTLAPLWAEARPAAVVFVEGAWWPALAARAQAAGVPVLRVSGRVLARWPLHRWLTDATTAVVARDEAARAWFAARGVAAQVGGELKTEAPVRSSRLHFARPVVVAASSRAGDEARVLAAVAQLPDRPQVLLAPRHLDRIEALEPLLAACRWARRSTLGEEVPTELDVVVLDTLGELAGLLRGARAAVIGGTWDERIGGHSPLEAARAGVPVLHGPHTRSQGDAFARVGGVCCDDAQALAAALAAPMPSRVPSGGAVERTRTLLLPHLQGPARESGPRPWAWPAVPAVRIGQGLHRAWRSRAPVRLEVPVVAVGSNNARGPGKTSTGRWWAAALTERGHTVGVAVRGYRRPARGLVVSWQDGSAEGLGDEGALYARDGHLVAACTDRVAGARALVSGGATVVLLDDGLAIRQLVRDRVLAVVDARYPTARAPIPVGERREALDVDELSGVVVHHGAAPDWLVGVPVAIAHRVPGPWQGRPPRGLVAAFAGLGRSRDFLESLEIEVARFRALPDHAAIGAELAWELLEWADGLPLVCTAKDQVRLPPSLRDAVGWRDLELSLDGVIEDWLAL